MITHLGGIELSRNTIVSMLNAERQEVAEALAAERAAERVREEAIERAEGEAQAHYREHGEWPWETAARAAELAAHREAAGQERARIERAEQQQAYTAQLLAAGRQPRSIGEVLAIAAMLP